MDLVIGAKSQSL